jgi:hypothetical protein
MVKTKFFFLAACLWVKESYTFNVSTVPGAAAVTDYHMIEWTLLGTAASQTN